MNKHRGLFAFATFCGFIAQVGIETRGKEISRAIGRTAIGTAITVAVVLALAGILAFGQLIVNPGYSRDQERVANIVVGVLVPISALVIMMMYQSLLGAGRRSLANRVADRD